MENQETLADIVAALRHNSKGLMFYFHKNETGSTHAMGADYADLADRIEAAAKRERAEIEANALAVGGVVEASRNKPSGNAAAMREALEEIVELAKAWATPGADAAVTLGLIIDRAKDALSAPPRQCDVGTAEEQGERFEKFCSDHWGSNDRSGNNCGMCPLSPFSCSLAWTQMPYEKGGAKCVR